MKRTPMKTIKKYFRLPYDCIRYSKIHALQYKIMTLIYPCRVKLYQWRITTDSTCLYCEQPDDLQHHFWFCPSTYIFWNSFRKWWSQFCNNCNVNHIKDVMLGGLSPKCHYVQLNYIILCCKWYIYRCEYLEQEIFFLQCLTYIKEKLIMEKMIYNFQHRTVKFELLWAAILDEL